MKTYWPFFVMVIIAAFVLGLHLDQVRSDFKDVKVGLLFIMMAVCIAVVVAVGSLLIKYREPVFKGKNWIITVIYERFFCNLYKNFRRFKIPFLLYLITWIGYIYLIVNRKHPFVPFAGSKDSLCHQLEKITPPGYFHTFRKWDVTDIICNSTDAEASSYASFFNRHGIESYSNGPQFTRIMTYYYDSTYEALGASNPYYKEAPTFDEEYLEVNRSTGNKYRICFLIFKQPPTEKIISQYRWCHITRIDAVRYYFRDYLNFDMEHRTSFNPQWKIDKQYRSQLADSIQ